MVDFICALIDSYIKTTGTDPDVLLCHPEMARHIKASIADPLHVRFAPKDDECDDDKYITHVCGLKMLVFPNLAPGQVVVCNNKDAPKYQPRERYIGPLRTLETVMQ